MTHPQVTDDQLRAAGFTAAARAFPLSARAAAWLAQFNGIPVADIPAAWWYAPNVYMQRVLDENGAAVEALTAPDQPAPHSEESQ